jgi:TolB-like protein
MKQKICLTLIFTFILTLLSQDILFARFFQSSRYSLAVIPFSTRGRISGDTSVRLAERLQEELSRTNMFSVSDLTNTQSTLRDNGIIPSNCGSIECGQQAGRVLGVRLVANGEVRRVGSRIILDVRILHVTSGNIVQSVSEQYYDGSIEAVINDMPAIAAKLIGSSAPAGRSVSQQPANVPPQQPQEDIIIDTQEQQEKEPVITTQQPEDIFTIGEESDATQGQPSLRKRGSGTKWALIGLLVAGGIGAGVLIAGGSGDDSGNNNGSGVVTKLPGHPKFP